MLVSSTRSYDNLRNLEKPMTGIGIQPYVLKHIRMYHFTVPGTGICGTLDTLTEDMR